MSLNRTDQQRIRLALPELILAFQEWYTLDDNRQEAVFLLALQTVVSMARIVLSLDEEAELGRNPR